jgi:small subunit ribosomal protein S16
MRRPLLVRPAWLICAVPSAVPPAGTGPPLRIYRWEKTTAVAVKIKLKRLGKIREPYYRIVVADARTKRDGRAIEEIGKYHPKAEPSFIEVNSERVQHWLSVGAQPTDPVRVLLKITGDWQKFTGEPGAEGTLRTAEPRADKKEAFTAAAKASQASKEAKEDKGSGQSRAGTQSRAAKPAKDTPAKESTAKESTAKESPAKESAAKESAKAPAAQVTTDAAHAATDALAADAPTADAPTADAPAADAPAADAAADAPTADAAADAPTADAPTADTATEGAATEGAETEGAADVKAAADEPGSGA